MAHKPCEKFTWCNMHDTEFEDDTLHSKHLGFGIELEFNETTGEMSVSWQPDWTDWQMKPGEIHQELRPLEAILGSLDYYFEVFRRQVAGEACIRCGAVDAPMIPVSQGAQGQLFACESHTEEAIC